MVKNNSSILDDQPAKQDFLDFDSYRQVLEELILDPNTKTPLTIGIFGRWGTGKTTLMHMLEQNLLKKGVTTVWFNAWQYSKEEQLWAAFLQSVLNKIEDQLKTVDKLKFKLKLLKRHIDKDKLVQQLIRYFFRIFIVVIPIIFAQLITYAKQYTLITELLQTSGNILSLILGIWIIAKPIFEAIQANVSLDFGAFRQESNYQEHIAFLDKFREHFTDIVNSLPQSGEKHLVVFIDDLDRCSDERMIQVLDATKLFVDISGCVYILGLDTEVVQQAIATKYKNDPIAQSQYVNKIIQLPFQLPPLTRNEMSDFLKNLSLELPDKRCQEVFITGLVVNPREIKRAINIFSLLWNLSTKRGELAGKINAVRLSKVVVIQHGYPDLHKLLQRYPHWLGLLEEHFRKMQKMNKNQKDDIKDIPVDIYEKLRRTLLKQEAFASDDKLRNIFANPHINRWQFDLPKVNTIDQRVDETINFLYSNYDDDNNGLVLFLDVLGENSTDVTFAELSHFLKRHLDILAEKKVSDLAPELQPFLNIESLREMLLLHSSPKVTSNETTDELNFYGLEIEDISAYFTLTSRAETPSGETYAIQWSIDPEGFLTTRGLEQLVRRYSFFTPDDEIVDTLLLLKTRKQRTWLITTHEWLICVLDDEDTQGVAGEPLQWELPLDNAKPIKARPSDEYPNSGLVDIGDKRYWLYSYSLHPDPQELERTIENMINRARQ